ncbi:MAG: FlgD immunoglobulin-like domain containing protein, partial [bacterium]
IELTFTASTLPTGLSESDLPLTGTFRLHSNYPNPFNPHTSIPFEIGDRRAVNVQLSVYNILGQKVAILLNEQLLPGKYEVTWNARDQSGDMVPSGLYFYKMQAGAFREVGNMILVK